MFDMNLSRFMQFGYALILFIISLMVWVSMIESKELEMVKHPPCIFNSLCSCSPISSNLGIVTCKDVHLPRIPEEVNISQAFKLHLENNNLRTLEPSYLSSTGLCKIVISNNPLYTIPDEAFLGLEQTLWELELSHCELIKIPSRSLKDLEKLTLLDLTGNHINKIYPENWRGLEKSLEILILADNSLTQIPLDAFGGLPYLDTIDLRGNNLREIDPAIFRDGMGRLAHLILADNQLSAIPYRALQPLKTLKTLDLSHNRINKMSLTTEPDIDVKLNLQLNLDTFKLDFNQLTVLETSSFRYFNILNKTYLDGNPLTAIEPGAFQSSKIRELYLRSCGLTNISPTAFAGLENYLELLDLSGNNISLLPGDLFERFQLIKSLSLSDNIMTNLILIEAFAAFQYTLSTLDLSGSKNLVIKIQDVKRFRNLRSLKLSLLAQPHLSSEEFVDFGVDLEEISINFANLQSVKSRTFKHIHGLKKIDLSDNSIGKIENDAFTDIGARLEHLRLAHAFSPSFKTIPADAFKVLSNLETLDLSNNKFKSMSETSFHFLSKLRILKLHDNIIEEIHKGTFQSDIHSNLEHLYLSFNNLKIVQQHTFVRLPKLEQLYLDDNKLELIERRSFMHLENLKLLNLKGNKLTNITHEAFQNLPELENLDLSFNRLTNLEFSMFDQVGNLATFHLNISHNKLSELVVNLPSIFKSDTVCPYCTGTGGFHSNIKVLDLSFNNISTIAKQFFKPAEISLTNLYLSHNNIMNVTRDVFGNMPHLQWLDLSRNHIYEMDFDMFRNTKKLQVLDVSHNRILEIPNDIFRFLSKLRIVNLSNNRIRALPDNLFREEGLERLDVSNNLLSKMPLNALATVAAQTLHEVDLSWNLISSLSHGGLIERFKKLNYLDLSYNRLAQIDGGTFKGLPKLLYLDISHNGQLNLEANGGSFQGVEYTLLHLNLNNVSLNNVPILPTPNLISLSLADNALPNMPPEMATNMTNLQRLNLDNNYLTIIPILTHSLFQLRHLSMVSNQITYLSNTSLLGVAEHLEELDIRNFDLTVLEAGAFCKMYSLRTLKMNLYTGFKIFNIPSIIRWNSGLRNLEIHVDRQSDSDLSREMAGDLPSKLKNITFSGRGLRAIGSNVLMGIKSPELYICIRNTSIMKIPSNFFKNTGRARNLSIDVRDNPDFRTLMNPSTGSQPGLFKKTFLKNLKIMGNRWDCDCDIGWIEVWQRKYRQYICRDNPINLRKDFTCRQTKDELRLSFCANKNNESVVEVLKSDIECGWSSASRLSSVYSISLIFVFTIIQQFIYH